MEHYARDVRGLDVDGPDGHQLEPIDQLVARCRGAPECRLVPVPSEAPNEYESGADVKRRRHLRRRYGHDADTRVMAVTISRSGCGSCSFGSAVSPATARPD